MKPGIREVVFSALLLAGLGGSYYKLAAMADAKRANEIYTQQQLATLDALQQSTRGIEDLDAKINSLSEAVRFFQAKLPKEGDVTTILERVDEIARTQTLSTRSFEPSRKIEVGPNYREQTIDIQFAGDFKNFYAFLLQLEQMPRLTRISRMSLKKIGDGEMEADVKLSIFFEPASTSSTPAAMASIR